MTFNPNVESTLASKILISCRFSHNVIFFMKLFGPSPSGLEENFSMVKDFSVCLRSKNSSLKPKTELLSFKWLELRSPTRVKVICSKFLQDLAIAIRSSAFDQYWPWAIVWDFTFINWDNLSFFSYSSLQFLISSSSR